MKKISIILPLHIINDEYGVMLKNAISSVEEFHEDVKLVIVCPPNVKDQIQNLSQKLEILYVVNNNETDFCSQVNLGIDNIVGDTEWFSILEVDDEYNKFWLKTMNTYINENPDVDVFLPVVKDINVGRMDLQRSRDLSIMKFYWIFKTIKQVVVYLKQMLLKKMECLKKTLN
jgi:hypothetical protein